MAMTKISTAALILSGLLAAGGAGAQSITEFPIPTPGLLPAGITSGPDGALWFAAGIGSPAKIGRIATDGTVTQFPLTTGGANPVSFGNVNSLTTGPDGAIWFTTSGAQIGRITTSGTVTAFATPSAGASTLGITTGPDGALWFTEGIGGAIGRITTAGAITEFTTGTRGSIADGIVTGPDGNLWFTDPGLGAIGRITPAGTVKYMALPSGADSTPGGIVAGPDGNIWFTELGAIGRITPGGQETDFLASVIGLEPASLTIGPDGALWFTDIGSNNAVGRMTLDGVLGEAPLPTAAGFTAGNLLDQIVAGPDGALWFVETRAGQIGRDQIQPSPLAAAVLPGSRSVETGSLATVFATVINAGSTSLSGCAIGIAGSAAAIQGGLTLSYQTTDPTTNAPTGTPNTPATIAAQGFQTFLLSFADPTPLAPLTLPLDFDCSGVESTALVTGVNTVDLAFSSTPVADVIALAATATPDQTVHLANNVGAFALASEDVGAAGVLTLETDTGGATLPISVSLCETNAAGQCQAAPAATLPVTFQAGSAPTFSVFVSASAPVPFAPGASRIFVRFKDASGASHGSTSVAVTTE
jgi:virginiamycin B lyase